jgi:hypothetical protein
MKLRPVLACVLLVNCGLAAAESSPYYLGVSQGFSHDSNIYRVSDGVVLPAGLSKGDTISTSSLLGGIDQPIGRQRLFGSAALRANRFKDSDSLNNQAYSANLGVDWETIHHLSGNLTAAATQSLARFNPDNDVPTVLKKNIERTQQLDAKARLGVVTRWTAETSFGWRKVDYSADEFRAREFSQNAASVGLRYSRSAALNLGAALRRTEGKFPQYLAASGGGFLADRYKRNDLDLTGTWMPTGASTIDGRLSFGKVEHSEALRRNFSGTTGSLRWGWKPTGKLTLNLGISRDTGEEINFIDTGNSSLSASDNFSRTTTAARLAVGYEVSAKISLNAGVSTARRSLVDTLNVGDSSLPREGRDTTNSVSLGGRWQPTRSLQFNCDMSRDHRNSNSALSDAYSVTTYGCTGQFVLQ